jgi:polyisoprenoid-binding protein YceI
MRFYFITFLFIVSLIFQGFSADFPSSLEQAPDKAASFVIEAEKSWVRFDAAAPLHEFSGITHKVSGEMSGIPKRLQETGKGRVVLEAATLDTDIGVRNKKMRSLLETDRYPEIEFTLDSLESIDEKEIPQGKLHFVVRGQLIVRGVTQEIRSEVDIEFEEGRLHIRGNFPTKMTDFGINPPSILGLKVRDEVTVIFDLVASPNPATRQTYPDYFLP